MTTPPLIRRLTLQNFLSYGPEGMAVDLLPLNVLIGPNASGKSNLLEALAILRATAKDLQAAIREGGGSGEYVRKGTDSLTRAVIQATVDDPFPGYPDLLTHRLELGRVAALLVVADEYIRESNSDDPSVYQTLYELSNLQPILLASVDGDQRTRVPVEGLQVAQSILSQRRDPVRYPEVTYLANFYSGIVLFQDWNFGRRAAARLPQSTDLPSDFLLPDASNLSLVLHDLGQTSAQREELVTYLRRFYESARHLSTKIYGGSIQLFIEEEGGRLISSTRLSDGTLRYLCLLAILCHPNPPQVIGIEEPELGLHPDILPTIAELLKKASERTQLFVTTHSDALVSALSDVPESILVCESMPQGTIIERLDPDKLRSWLDEYRLGEIWRMGEIGGNRW